MLETIVSIIVDVNPIIPQLIVAKPARLWALIAFSYNSSFRASNLYKSTLFLLALFRSILINLIFSESLLLAIKHIHLRLLKTARLGAIKTTPQGVYSYITIRYLPSCLAVPFKYGKSANKWHRIARIVIQE